MACNDLTPTQTLPLPGGGIARPTLSAFALVALAAAATLIVIACGGGPATEGPTARPVTVAATQAPQTATPPQTWAVVSEDLEAVFATPDLAPGPQRIAFVLSDDRGLVRLPIVQVRSFRHPKPKASDGLMPGPEGPVETATARFHEFPLGTRGIYVTELRFDQPGDWSIEVNVPRPDGAIARAEIFFAVSERTKSVAVGERPPPSRNRTLRDVPSVSHLTTGSHRDPNLYQTAIADALTSNRPTVVVFASPAFCTNAVCGPQVEVLSEIQDKYAGRANFIHVDYYDNPHEIQGDLDRAVPSPVLTEWGLTSQEWTFVIGSDGRVSRRFENFAPAVEIEAALEAALAAG